MGDQTLAISCSSRPLHMPGPVLSASAEHKGRYLSYYLCEILAVELLCSRSRGREVLDDRHLRPFLLPGQVECPDLRLAVFQFQTEADFSKPTPQYSLHLAILQSASPFPLPTCSLTAICFSVCLSSQGVSLPGQCELSARSLVVCSKEEHSGRTRDCLEHSLCIFCKTSQPSLPLSLILWRYFRAGSTHL